MCCCLHSTGLILFSVPKVNIRTRLEHIKNVDLTSIATSSLFNALRRLRPPDSRRLGWEYTIDCILAFRPILVSMTYGREALVVSMYKEWTSNTPFPGCCLYFEYAKSKRFRAMNLPKNSNSIPRSESVLTLLLKCCSRAAIDNGQMPSITGTSSIIDLQLFPK